MHEMKSESRRLGTYKLALSQICSVPMALLAIYHATNNGLKSVVTRSVEPTALKLTTRHQVLFWLVKTQTSDLVRVPTNHSPSSFLLVREDTNQGKGFEFRAVGSKGAFQIVTASTSPHLSECCVAVHHSPLRMELLLGHILMLQRSFLFIERLLNQSFRLRRSLR
jgi:hypothetical protein